MKSRGLVFSLIGFLVLVVVAGCSSRVAPSISTKVEVRDSIVYQEVPRIVEVKVPGEKVTITKYIECDSVTNKPKPVEIKVKSAKSKASVSVKVDSTGLMTATGGCDSLKLALEVMDKELFHYKHEKSDTKEVKPQIIYKTLTIDIFCRWFSAIVLVVLGIVFYDKIFN
jgi:hypothetical protein